MTRLRLALAAVLLAAGAQPPPAAPAPAVRPWQVDWGQYYCSAIRKADANRPFATAFVMTPGMRGMHIALIRQRDGEMPVGVTDVVLMPAGASFSVTPSAETVRRSDIQRLYGLPLEFADQLAGARTLELRTEGRLRERVPLDGVQAALAANRECLSAVAGEWGLDLAALAALSKRPDSQNNLGLTIDDYPMEALRRATQGRVVVRVDLSAAGRATACVPVASSGSREIDGATCRSAMTRAQFMPALDAAGRPVAARVVFMATFRLPGG